MRFFAKEYSKAGCAGWRWKKEPENVAQRQAQIYLRWAKRLLLSKFVVSHNCAGIFNRNLFNFFLKYQNIATLLCLHRQVNKGIPPVSKKSMLLQAQTGENESGRKRMGKWLIADYFVSSILFYTKILFFTWRCGFETRLKMVQNSDFLPDDISFFYYNVCVFHFILLPKEMQQLRTHI